MEIEVGDVYHEVPFWSLSFLYYTTTYVVTETTAINTPKGYIQRIQVLFAI